MGALFCDLPLTLAHATPLSHERYDWAVRRLKRKKKKNVLVEKGRSFVVSEGDAVLECHCAVVCYFMSRCLTLIDRAFLAAALWCVCVFTGLRPRPRVTPATRFTLALLSTSPFVVFFFKKPVSVLVCLCVFSRRHAVIKTIDVDA